MKQFILKHSLKALMLFAVCGMIFTTSCSNDDEGPDEPGDPIVEDGLYVAGAGTAFATPNIKFLMKSTRNEVLQENRAELFELFVAVEGGAGGFNIVEVAGATTTTYGPGSDFMEIPTDSLDVDEPKNGLWKGDLTSSSTAFTVPSDGLYHVIIDKGINKVAIAKADWGLIGGATPGGWSDDTPMTATFNKEKMEFVVENVTMLENDWKFRYSNGWKVILDPDFDLGSGQAGIKVNSNVGGDVANLVPGGDNISNTEYAVYKFTMTWEAGGALLGTQEKTGEGVPLADYPEELYMIGASLGGWDWAANGLQMNPVHSHPELFWKILRLEGGVTDAGVKFAPQKDWIGDFGVDGDYDADGVIAKGTNNLMVPGEITGYYMVVVNFETEQIEVVTPKVYLLGDCVGNWDATMNELNIMNVDDTNMKITKTADLAAGDLRLYTSSKIMGSDWWQSEFMLLNSIIEYRGTGDDQERVNLTAGTYTISLDFTDNTGSIN